MPHCEVHELVASLRGVHGSWWRRITQVTQMIRTHRHGCPSCTMDHNRTHSRHHRYVLLMPSFPLQQSVDRTRLLGCIVRVASPFTRPLLRLSLLWPATTSLITCLHTPGMIVLDADVHMVRYVLPVQVMLRQTPDWKPAASKKDAVKLQLGDLVEAVDVPEEQEDTVFWRGCVHELKPDDEV